MTTPAFIVELRRKIGHDLLWLTGVTGYVEDEQGRVLLGKRADTGEWALIYGINEPGEQPGDTMVREVKEETGVDAEVTDLVSLTSSSRIITYDNGDQAQYMDCSFLCRLAPDGNATASTPDHENSDSGWFALDALPKPLAASTVERIKLFQRYRANRAAGDAHALFVVNGTLQ